MCGFVPGVDYKSQCESERTSCLTSSVWFRSSGENNLYKILYVNNLYKQLEVI